MTVTKNGVEEVCTRASKSTSNSCSSLAQTSKRKSLARRSEDSVINNEHASDEEEGSHVKAMDPGPVRPKRKSNNSTSGDGDVPRASKLSKSASNSGSSLAQTSKRKGRGKGPAAARQSEPLSLTDEDHVTDEEEGPLEEALDPEPVRPKRKSKNSTSASGDRDVPPVKKPRKSRGKVMNKKERDSLKASIISLDPSIFHGVITEKFKAEQTLSERLKHFASSFLEKVELLNEIIVFHRHYFAALYTSCKKGQDPFMRFQFQWYDHCSALLLSKQHSISEIGLEEIPSAPMHVVRSKWLMFCETSGVPVPESNPVMMLVSSTIYDFLLEYSKNFQNKIHQAEVPSIISTVEPDTDDVYYRFGGAAICDMLHLRYKQLKSCPDTKRDKLSQEISLLQAINCKDKTTIPGYMCYRDRGFMYFPDKVFLPLLREVDDVIKHIVNFDGLKQEGDNLIKVLYFSIYRHFVYFVFLL